MPELPEVETVRRILDPNVKGQTITGVTIGAFSGVLESRLVGVDPILSLTGHTVQSTSRRGKYLFLHLDNDLVLIVHLRMTGRLLLLPATAPPIRFQHLAIHLASGADLRFADQRKFGRVTLATSADVEALDRKLGPEPDSRTLIPRALHASLARRPGKIKNALLDQSLIAGLGNIYVDEALYRSRIHPERSSNSLTVKEIRRLLRAIRTVINLAIRNQGTTFSSFENPYGESGDNARFLRAYGRSRDGSRCARCGSPFERIVVGGRGTTFCPRCQIMPNQEHAPPSGG